MLGKGKCVCFNESVKYTVYCHMINSIAGVIRRKLMPDNAVSVNTVHSFERRFDKYMNNQAIVYQYDALLVLTGNTRDIEKMKTWI